MKNFYQSLTGIIFNIVLLKVTTSVVYAQEFFFPKPAQIRISSIGEFVGAGGSLLFIIGVIIFMALFLWGGVEWLTSGGDKGKIQNGRERIMQALIGLTILSLGAAVIILLERFLGIKIIGSNLPIPRAFGP